MRRMVFVVHQLTSYGQLRHIRGVAAHVAALLDGAKYMEPNDLPRLEGTVAPGACAVATLPGQRIGQTWRETGVEYANLGSVQQSGLRHRLQRLLGLVARPSPNTLPTSDGEDIRKPPLSMRKANLSQLLARRVDGIFLSDFEQGEIGPDLFRHACLLGLEGLVSKRRDRPYRAGRSPH